MSSRYTTEESEDKYSSIVELQNLQLDFTLTPGAESSNVVNLAVQAKSDHNQNNLAVPCAFDFYFSDSSAGLGLVATAPSGTVAVGTNGTVLDLTGAKKMFRGITNASGTFDLNITESGAKTMYVAVIAPNGKLIVSTVLTWS